LKAPSFAYAKPRTLAEAFELIERPGAKILAGGQSLIPSLNMRLSAPELLVDITGLAGLSNIEAKNGAVRIGALCTHAMVERSPEVLLGVRAPTLRRTDQGEVQMGFRKVGLEAQTALR